MSPVKLGMRAYVCDDFFEEETTYDVGVAAELADDFFLGVVNCAFDDLTARCCDAVFPFNMHCVC